MGALIRIGDEEVSEHEMFVAKGALADGIFQVRYLGGYALTRSFALSDCATAITTGRPRTCREFAPFRRKTSCMRLANTFVRITCR